jgi:hypothetical protein
MTYTGNISMWLRPTSQCEAETILCGYYEVHRTYQQALAAARKHTKETGHIVRAEHIRTELVGL